MRAMTILQLRLRDGAEILHAKQWAALWRAVAGLLDGGQLWLTALGRSLPGQAGDKHRIKAVDRLLGSPAIQAAIGQLSGVLAGFLLRKIRRPVILVDWTGGGSSAFYILSAKLCFRGRALSIYSHTFPVKRKCSPKAEREFLAELVAVIPARCSPIIVTDAGFLFEWLESVRAVGWDFVGRLRNGSFVLYGGRWVTFEELHALAGKKAKSLGVCKVRQTDPYAHRLVLSKKRKLKGRHRITFNGTKGKNTADRQRSTAAREPLLLATSLSDRSVAVVDMYCMRMQIEETFRDLKSHRYGWSLEDVRCRTAIRVDVLLLIAAFAAVAMHIVGLAAQQMGLDRGMQANTERKRPVFSTFFLAKLMIRRGRHALIFDSHLFAALRQLHHLLAQAASS
jgi:hypothetical protein